MALKVKDIAEMLGVSPATVSLVLNNKPGVSEETRNKVLEAVGEMGYDTNLLSKPALKQNKNIRFIVYKKHGNVVSDTPFFLALMEGMEQEARKSGYNLMVSYMSQENNRMELLRVISENPPEGMILLATEMQREDLIPFMEKEIPLVIVDSYFEQEKLDTIVINNVQGAYEAVKYLLDMGHTQIGYLRSSTSINNFAERKDGLMKALRECHLKLDKAYEFELASSMEGAYKDMAGILNEKPALPTAFFADNDIIACGAIKALKEYGIGIPEEISVVGFDDMPFCEVMEPTLTTVKVYKQRIGIMAVRRLIEKIEGDALEFIKLEVGTQLVERKSVERKKHTGN